MKKFFKIISVAIIILLFSIVLSNIWVTQNAKNVTFTSTSKIPTNKVGLLLGTSKWLFNGHNNLYYIYRINATVELFKSGKIKYVLISGDNGTKKYDEPTMMKNDLISKGIPKGKIFLDYAGFRTLDSVVRAKEIFGQESITIISQPFHTERAIFIAENKGIKAVGFNAKDVSKRYGIKVQIREKLARVKMLIDLLFNTKPKFLGEKISIQ